MNKVTSVAEYLSRYQKLKFFRNSGDRHWLFWPLVLLILFIAVYAVLLSNNGYLAYTLQVKERDELKNQVKDLIQTRENLESRLGVLKDDDKALEKFTRDLMMYRDSVWILKFEDKPVSKESTLKNDEQLPYWQKIYIAISSVLMLFVTIIVWKFNRDEDPV